MIIGLTGGIATGKSTVTNVLKQRGQAIVDSDLIAREVVAPNRSAYNQIVAHFGTHILLPNLELDRAKLGQLIFSNPNERKVLEGITHPAIFAEMDMQIAQAKRNGHQLVFLDVPLLIETGMHQKVDKVVLVYANQQTQLTRLMARDQMSKVDAEKRIAAQMPIEEKRAYADFIIENNGSIEQLELQINELLTALLTGAL